MLCLIYHRNFDGVIALYDSNRYIKRLNNIKIEKNALFWAVKSQFSDGGAQPTDTPYIGVSIGDNHTPATPVLNSQLRPWLSTQHLRRTSKEWLARNQDNVSRVRVGQHVYPRNVVSVSQHDNTNSTWRVRLVQSGPHHHQLKSN